MTPSGKNSVGRCLLVLAVSNFLTPLDTQAFTPLLPLLLTEAMRQQILVVGHAFAILTGAAVVSFVAIIPLSKIVSPRSLLLLMYAIRTVSGVVYCTGLWGDSRMRLALLFASRAIYGLSLMTFALPAIWISVRLPVEDRPSRITAMMAVLQIGVVLGPAWGTMMAGLAPTAWQGYAMPGYFTVAESAVNLILIAMLFDDVELLPTVAPPASTEYDKEAARTSRIVFLVACWSSVCYIIGFMTGFETIMSLSMLHSFGWGARDSLGAWGTFAIFSMMGFALAPALMQKVNWAWLAAISAPAGLLLWLGLGINHSNLGQPVPVWSLFASFAAIVPSSIVGTLALAAVSTKVLPHEQVKANAVIQLLSQASRGIGPLLVTNWYEFFVGRYGESSAYNGTVLFNVCFMVLGYLPLICHFTTFFGKFSNPILSGEKRMTDLH